MKILVKNQTCRVVGGGIIEDAAIERLRFGYFGMLLGAGLSATYIGEVALFPWLTLPATFSTIAGAWVGAYLGAYLSQCHFNAVMLVTESQAFAGVEISEASSS